MVYLHNKILFICLKKVKFEGKWMELETVILSKVTPIQKDKCLVFFHMWKNHWTGVFLSEKPIDVRTLARKYGRKERIH